VAYAGRMKSVSVSKLGKKFVKSSSERVASLEAQLKAKNKELKEYKARIVELEEENSELRILLAETDLDESAVLIRPDGGDNYKASEEEMQHPLGDEGISVTSPATTTAIAFSRLKGLGKSEQNEEELLLDFVSELSDRGSSGTGIPQNPYSLEGSTQTNGYQLQGIAGNRTVQRLKSATTSVKQSFGKSRTFSDSGVDSNPVTSNGRTNGDNEPVLNSDGKPQVSCCS